MTTEKTVRVLLCVVGLIGSLFVVVLGLGIGLSASTLLGNIFIILGLILLVVNILVISRAQWLTPYLKQVFGTFIFGAFVFVAATFVSMITSVEISLYKAYNMKNGTLDQTDLKTLYKYTRDEELLDLIKIEEKKFEDLKKSFYGQQRVQKTNTSGVQ